jgi:hypothetical protein
VSSQSAAVSLEVRSRPSSGVYHQPAVRRTDLLLLRHVRRRSSGKHDFAEVGLQEERPVKVGSTRDGDARPPTSLSGRYWTTGLSSLLFFCPAILIFAGVVVELFFFVSAMVESTEAFSASWL